MEHLTAIKKNIFLILKKKVIHFRLYLGYVTLQDVIKIDVQRHLAAAKDS